MQARLSMIIVSLSSALLLACGDGSDSRGGDSSTPEPEVNLDETGIYSGTLVADNGAVALMSLQLGRDGSTAITLEEDDSERATTVLWGKSDGSDGAITFEGSDTDSGDGVTTDLLFNGTAVSGYLEVAGLAGDYQLDLEAFSARASSLQSVSGNYARNDNLSGLNALQVSEDGSVQLTGACEGSGSVSTIDPQVNLYRLELDSECASWDVLVSLQDIEVEEDVISLAGDGGDSRLAWDFYRL